MFAALGLMSCQVTTAKNESKSSVKTDTSPTTTAEPAAAEETEMEGYQSFAFFEGIKEDGKRSPSRSDGTTHGMPCITKAVIAKSEEAKYDFWHGHDRELHRFTLTSENLAVLKSGKSIEVFTAVVDRHKHAVKIDMEKPCKVDSTNQAQ
jgi:hypothetical protein